MAPKVFITGVTGYIGGQAFADLHSAHPDWDYTILVRNEGRGAPVLDKYPKVRLAYGSLSDADVIEKEAAAADIVIHTANSSDDVPSAEAIAKGLAAGHSEEKPGYWIHVSGTGILTWYDNDNKRFGEAPLPEQEYNDVAGIDGILSLPDSAPHRDVDKIVLAANSPAVRTAIVAPPCIFGVGRGPVNTRSMQVPDLALFTLEKGFAPIIGTGLTEWDNVHVHDLGALFVLLADAARDPARAADQEVFGPKAYYFVRTATHVWADVARSVARAASRLGFLPAALTKETSFKVAVGQGGTANATWALNSKGIGERAAKYLGWSPKAPSLEDEIPGFVELEAKSLGLVPHEKKVE